MLRHYQAAASAQVFRFRLPDLRAQQAHIVLGIEEMNAAIRRDFEKAQKRSGYVVLVICSPISEYFKVIESKVENWNHLSGPFITIIIPGYVGYLEASERPENRYSRTDTIFDYKGFSEIVEKFEGDTAWKYEGGCDIIGMLVKINDSGIVWDYQQAVVFNAEKVSKHAKFDLDAYIKDIISKSKDSIGHDPTNLLAESSTINTILAIVLLVLPKQLIKFAQEYTRINMMAPRRVSAR